MINSNSKMKKLVNNLKVYNIIKTIKYNLIKKLKVIQKYQNNKTSMKKNKNKKYKNKN